MRIVSIAAILALGLVASACGSSAATRAPAEEAAPTVEWQDYAPGVQARIDDLARARDCVELQDEFDTAEASGPATFNRVGHNNAKLMSYIDAAMRGAGCY